jgi:hypothetical protein
MGSKESLVYSAIILAAVTVIGYGEAGGSGGIFPTWDLRFQGQASGGVLILCKNGNRYVNYVPIETFPGESGESVAQRLADTITAHHSRQTQHVGYDPHWLWVGKGQVIASGAALRLPLGWTRYILAGTEPGLGIPKPPRCLSSSYSDEEDNVVLRWQNPADDEYDFILVYGRWTEYDHRLDRRLTGTSTSFIIDRKKIQVDLDDMDFLVLGFRDMIPSNAAAIHVSCGGHCQEETYGIPFSGGIAPNWMVWGSAGQIDKAVFEQGENSAYARSGTPRPRYSLNLSIRS